MMLALCLLGALRLPQPFVPALFIAATYSMFRHKEFRFVYPPSCSRSSSAASGWSSSFPGLSMPCTTKAGPPAIGVGRSMRRSTRGHGPRAILIRVGLEALP